MQRVLCFCESLRGARKMNLEVSLEKVRHLMEEGEFSIALEKLKNLNNIYPQNTKIKEYIGYTCYGLGNKKDGDIWLKNAAEKEDCSASTLYEYGSLLLEESPNSAKLYLERALKKNPESFEVLHDLASACALSGDKERALDLYLQASQIKLDSAELVYNIARIYDEKKKEAKAIEYYRIAVQLDPSFVSAWINLGLDLNYFGLYEESIECLKKALTLSPQHDLIFGDYIHIKMLSINWDDYEQDLKDLKIKIELHNNPIHPFHFLNLVDSPILQKNIAENYTKRNILSKLDDSKIQNLRSEILVKHAKIKVGYFSADLREHPVTFLTVELFELHNRKEFEIYAFSFGPNENTEMFNRVKSSFDHFIDVRDKSDEDIADLSREHGIDIAVDLGGYTEGSRSTIFAYRAAPIQVSYIGYLGTMGAPFIDYLIADKVIIPDGYQHFYTEKIAYLPSYQINDRKKVISTKQYRKDEIGIKDNIFLFCCFNNTYKINPAIFDSWMKILKAVDNSSLYLFAPNQVVEKNYRKEAMKRGINENRLIFGGIIPRAEYLARYRVADLFLDTNPYNAGTTASDALSVGLPVLTLKGSSFSSRVAASLLTAFEIPELIAETSEEYEAKAIELAIKPEKLLAIRKKMEINISSTRLFDAEDFVKNLENIFKKMYNRYLQGLKPDSISL